MPKQISEMNTASIKVCMVVNQTYHTDTRVISYANALAEKGAQVDIISSRQSPEHETNPKPNIRIHPIPVARNFDNGLGYLVNYFLSIIFFTLYAAILHFRHRYHVIHIHNMPDTLIVSALIPKLLGAKVILDIHDPMPNVFMSKFQQGSKSMLVEFLKAQERISAKLADEVITANPIFKEELSSRGIPAEKLLVINNIPNPQIFNRKNISSPGQPSRKNFTLIYPGTIAPRYSLDIPIRALPQLSKEIPNIQLKIIGKHSKYSDELVALASKLNVSEYLNMASHLPANQIAFEIASADIGIYSAIPDAHMDIAMPGKVLEYAMMGIPVVASRLRILEAFFDDLSMLFFPPGNVEDFTSQVLKLYNNPSLKTNLTQNADASFTNKYTWQNEFEKYLDTIQHLVFE